MAAPTVLLPFLLLVESKSVFGTLLSEPPDCVPRSAVIPAQIGSASVLPEMQSERIGGRRASMSGPLNVVFWGR